MFTNYIFYDRIQIKNDSLGKVKQLNGQNTNYEHIYIAIDLKSFYASVECRERGLNPLTTNLVVADSSRTEKTIWNTR